MNDLKQQIKTVKKEQKQLKLTVDSTEEELNESSSNDRNILTFYEKIGATYLFKQLVKKVENTEIWQTLAQTKKPQLFQVAAGCGSVKVMKMI